MSSNFKTLKKRLLTVFFATTYFLSFSQGNKSSIKAQIALGVNSPSSNGFVNNFEAKSINFPSINLGVQYMFKPLLGAKLDFGYNRFSNLKNTPDFKVNYTRLNVQMVYDATKILGLPPRIGVFPHIGPGFSMIKPLGNYTQNNVSFLNVMGGLEFHYGVTDTFSLYLDSSYIMGFGKEFNPVTDGFGSFNGNILTINLGLSLSLSGCYYCEND